MIIGWTGHRPDKLGGYGANATQVHVKGLIRCWHCHLRPQVVVTGMAEGVDEWVAEDCLANAIPYVAAIPFVGQERLWPREAQLHYAQLLAGAKSVKVCGELPEHHTLNKDLVNRLMEGRNKWVVHHVDLLMGLWDGTRGGTANCIHYAQAIRRPVGIVSPTESTFQDRPPLPLDEDLLVP